jgi:hypothetical protein
VFPGTRLQTQAGSCDTRGAARRADRRLMLRLIVQVSPDGKGARSLLSVFNARIRLCYQRKSPRYQGQAKHNGTWLGWLPGANVRS